MELEHFTHKIYKDFLLLHLDEYIYVVWLMAIDTIGGKENVLSITIARNVSVSR